MLPCNCTVHSMVSSPNVLWAPKYHPGFALSPPDHHHRHHRLVVVYTCSTIDTGQLLRLNIAVIVWYKMNVSEVKRWKMMLTILKPPPLTTELHGEPAGGDLLRRLVNGGRRSMQETPSNYCDSRNKNEDLVAWMLDSHPAGCLEDCLGINALVSKRRPRHFLSLTLWRVIMVRKSWREMRTVLGERPPLWNSSIGDAVSQIRTGNKVSPGRRAHWCPPDWQADPRPSQVLGRECHNWLWCHICIFSQLIYTISFDFTNSRRRRICLVKCTTTYHNICKCTTMV